MEKEMALTLNQLLFRTFHEKDNMLQSVRDELGLGRGQPRILTYLLSHESGSQNDGNTQKEWIPDPQDSRGLPPFKCA